MAFGFWRRNSTDSLEHAPTLSEGAALVYREAKARRFPLSFIAERHSLGPQFWFADSLLRQSAVYGKPRGENAFAHIFREQLANLTLATDMSALQSGAPPESQVTDLRTPTPELRRYLRWARTVQ